MMKGEIINFIIVWSVAITLFLYSYTIGKVVPNGRGRLVALFPPTLILLLLPIWLTEVHLIIISTFCLSWLSTFKLLLFAFAKGPLSSNPPPSLFQFLLVSSLPIKFQHNNHTNENQIKFTLTSLNKSELLVMSILLYFFALPYEKTESFHPLMSIFLYFLHVYTGLEILFTLITAFARNILQLELEKPFNKPFLSTTLKELWGRRWNVMVSRILHPTVYKPMVKAFSHIIGRKWAPIPAVVVTFMVSGLMHELIYYYLKPENAEWEPCWDSMCFFFIHGVFVALEIAYKKAFKPKQQLLPRIVSCTLTMGFFVTTALTLFIPVIVRSAGR